MEFKPTPAQVLVLWTLAFTGQTPMISKLVPRLTPKSRRELTDAGLVRLEKRGRATHVIITDTGLDWVEANLNASCSRSAAAAPVLEKVLAMLKDHLTRHGFELAEFITPAAGVSLDSGRSEKPDLADRIHSAYLALSQGESNVRVRLADLAEYLDDLTNDELTGELVSMQKKGLYGVVLWPLDDPRDIGPEDRAVAVNLGGVERHILYMEA
jgi:hypothetical protein